LLEYLSVSGVDPSNTLAVIGPTRRRSRRPGWFCTATLLPARVTNPQYETFYDMEVNGIKLVDWIDALITGKPLDDVHCDKCVTE
jgi:hypothetical protein